jgi:YegS/Rv2252/BmrU family lipid kinase
MDHKRALVLVNRSGRRGRRRVDTGVDALEEAGFEVSVLFARNPDRIPEAIRRRGKDVDIIVIGGGDGTISHACSAVLESGRPLGILPLGNANDLARTLGLPTDPLDAFRVIAAGKSKKIDVGWVNGRPFLNVASLGVSVAIARRLTGALKRRWGVLGYAKAAWDAMQTDRSFRAHVTCDGESETLHAIQIAVGNGRFYGGGLVVADDATIDDNRLDVYAIPRIPNWRWLTLLPAMASGTHRHHAEVLARHGRSVDIETDRPMPINVDGEILAETPAEFSVQPGALEVFVP